MKIEKTGIHFLSQVLSTAASLFSPKQSVRHLPELVATYPRGFLHG